MMLFPKQQTDLPKIKSPFSEATFLWDAPREPSNQIEARITGTKFVSEFIQRSISAPAEVDRAKYERAFSLALARNRWQRPVFDPHMDTDVDSLTDTVDAVLSCISEFGPESISFAMVQRRPFQVEHLAAALRAASSWSDLIPDWEMALHKCRDVAIDVGLEPNDLLYGMIE